jgi:hypothetical protein
MGSHNRRQWVCPSRPRSIYRYHSRRPSPQTGGAARLQPRGKRRPVPEPGPLRVGVSEPGLLLGDGGLSAPSGSLSRAGVLSRLFLRADACSLWCGSPWRASRTCPGPPALAQPLPPALPSMAELTRLQLKWLGTDWPMAFSPILYPVTFQSEGYV